jgi:hypothetical protein
LCNRLLPWNVLSSLGTDTTLTRLLVGAEPRSSHPRSILTPAAAATAAAARLEPQTCQRKIPELVAQV